MQLTQPSTIYCGKAERCLFKAAWHRVRRLFVDLALLFIRNDCNHLTLLKNIAASKTFQGNLIWAVPSNVKKKPYFL